jgi:hypothetical protein
MYTKLSHIPILIITITCIIYILIPNLVKVCTLMNIHISNSGIFMFTGRTRHTGTAINQSCGLPLTNIE